MFELSSRPSWSAWLIFLEKQMTVNGNLIHSREYMKFNRVNSDIQNQESLWTTSESLFYKHIKEKKYHAQAKHKYLEF